MEDWMKKVMEFAEKAAKEHHEKIAKDARHELQENSVTKSNALARSYYRYGLVEKRVMESCISMLNPQQFNPRGTQEIELRAVDYARTFGVSEKIAYRDLKSAMDSLLHHVIVIRESEKKVLKYPLMSKAEYMEGEGLIVVEFNPHLVHHLIGLRDRFSSYPLKKALDFKSSYTWRLYELFVSWAKSKEETKGVFSGWFTVSVDEFRQQMGIPDSYLWINVDRVITKATQELWEKLRIKTVVTRIKRGRKISQLQFEFSEAKSADK